MVNIISQGVLCNVNSEYLKQLHLSAPLFIQLRAKLKMMESACSIHFRLL